MTDDDITAQALFFFLAGFEITATIMCLVSHELAVHPEIQERLRKEVDGVMEASKGKITYDDLMGMKYLDMVVLGIESRHKKFVYVRILGFISSYEHVDLKVHHHLWKQ